MSGGFVKEAKIMLASAAMGMVVMLLVGAYTFVYSNTTQREIADNVLRFHVMAHSDDADEQRLKNLVRDRVLMEFETVLTGGASLAVAREIISENLEDITRVARAAVAEAGYEHEVTAELTHAFFPTTFYGDLVFPPGRYETVQIVIGDGVGRNWWCLMFPPLCYVEMTSTTQTRDILYETVPGSGFQLLTYREQPNTSVAVRFRVVEWWQNRRSTTPPNNATFTASN